MVAHTPHVGVSLITRCFTQTQTSLDWAPGWPKLAESANLHRFCDNTNYRGRNLDLLPHIHVFAFSSWSVDNPEPHRVVENIMSWDKTWINWLQHLQLECTSGRGSQGLLQRRLLVKHLFFFLNGSFHILHEQVTSRLNSKLNCETDTLLLSVEADIYLFFLK